MLTKHFTQQPPPPVYLTVEEEAILADDMSQATTDMENVGVAMDRTTDTATVNADASEVVATLPEAGDVEKELVASVAEMAVAGTDSEADDIVVDTEPTDGLSTENLAETVKNAVLKVWETIKQGLLKLWDTFTNFFKQISAYLTGIKSKVAKTRKLLDAHERKLADRKIEAGDKFKGNVALLLVNGKPSDHFGTDFTNFRTAALMHLEVMANYGVALIEEGSDLFEHIAKDPGKVERNHERAYLNKFHNTLNGMRNAMHLVTNESTGELEPDTTKYLGGFGIVGKFPTINMSKEFDDALSKLGAFGMELTKVQPTKIDIALTNKIDNIRTVITQSEEWLKAVEKNNSRIQDVVNKAKAAREHLDKVAKQGSEDKDAGDKAKIQKHMSQILSINGRINKVVASMLASTLNRGNATVNTALEYCIQSLNLAGGEK